MVERVYRNKTRGGIFWPQAQGSGEWGKEKIDERSKTSSKGIQDKLGFWIPRHEFRIPGTGFQSLVDSEFFRVWDVFRIGKPKIPNSTSKNFPDSVRNPISLIWADLQHNKFSLTEREPCWCAFRQHWQHLSSAFPWPLIIFKNEDLQQELTNQDKARSCSETERNRSHKTHFVRPGQGINLKLLFDKDHFVDLNCDKGTTDTSSKTLGDVGSLWTKIGYEKFKDFGQVRRLRSGRGGK